MFLDTGKWSRIVLWTGTSLALLALVLVGLNMTSVPLRAARGVTQILEERTGWHVEIKSARLVGPTRLQLRDVSFAVPGDDIRGVVPRAYVSVNPIQYLFAGDSQPNLGKIDLVHPRLHASGRLWGGWMPGSKRADKEAPSPDGATNRGGKRSVRHPSAIRINVIDGTIAEGQDGTGSGRLWDIEGEFSLDVDKKLHLKPVRFHLSTNDKSVHLRSRTQTSGDNSVLVWSLKGPAGFVTSLAKVVPWQVSGALEASGTMPLDDTGAGSFEAHIRSGDVRWGSVGTTAWNPFDELRLKADYDRGRFEIKDVVVSVGDGTIRGEGTLASDVDGGFVADLSVAATDLSLPHDVPVLSEYGLSGAAQFTGVLSGKVIDPVLSGRLKIADGTVWHRPVTRGEGVILVRQGRFTFGQTQLVRGEATYDVSGEWQKTADGASYRVDLDAKNGSIPELLKATGLQADAKGTLTGNIAFSGTGEDLRVEGDAAAREVVFKDQALDKVSGRFVWTTADGLTLDDAKLALGKGDAVGSGRITSAAVDLDVALTHWPVDGLNGSTLSAPGGMTGWLTYTGRVRGSLADPRVEGNVRDGQLKIGRWELTKPAGAVTLDKDVITLSDVRVVGVGSGTYGVTGRIQEWRGVDPDLQLQLKVEEASLSRLLSDSGLSFPAKLFDGQVVGEIQLDGHATQPVARFDLALSDELGIGDPIHLKFQYDRGRLRLGSLLGLLGLRSAS